MKTYTYSAEQFLRTDLETAWRFFSSPRNLAVITPPELDFRILTTLDENDIVEGMIIDYTVKPLFGLPVGWKTEICDVERPFYFSDRQLKGPYHTWIHKHTFRQENDGVLMKDEVRYALPFGWIGQLTHKLVVKKKIEEIFHYRRQVLHKLFVENEYMAH